MLSYPNRVGFICYRPETLLYYSTVVSFRVRARERKKYCVYTYFKKGCFSDPCFIDRSASHSPNLWLLFSRYDKVLVLKQGQRHIFYDFVFSWSPFSEKSDQSFYL